MIQFNRSHDYNLIRQILTHSRVYDKISDDYSPSRDEYRPIEHDAIWYVVARQAFPAAEGIEPREPDLLGLWMFHPLNGICWEVHTALLPIAYGVPGHQAARLLPAWIWENTPCRRIVSTVPTTNRLALHFAVDAGMKMWGINEASWLKNGMLCDQVCFGISAPQETGHGATETAQDSIGTVPVGPEEEV